MAEEMNQMGMTPYETIKVAHMNNRGDRAVGIVGLVVAGVGAVAGVNVARHFFFHDEDFSDENKVFWYFEWQLF